MGNPATPFDATSIIDTLNNMRDAATSIDSAARDIYGNDLEEYGQIATYKICDFFLAVENATTAVLSYMRSTLNTQYYGETGKLVSCLLTHLPALILASTDIITCLNDTYGQEDNDDAEIIGYARPDEQALDLLTRALPELDTIARKILTVSQDVIDNTPEDSQWKQHPYNSTYPFKTLNDLPDRSKP